MSSSHLQNCAEAPFSAYLASRDEAQKRAANKKRRQEITAAAQAAIEAKRSRTEMADERKHLCPLCRFFAVNAKAAGRHFK